MKKTTQAFVPRRPFPFGKTTEKPESSPFPAVESLVLPHKPEGSRRRSSSSSARLPQNPQPFCDHILNLSGWNGMPWGLFHGDV